MRYEIKRTKYNLFLSPDNFIMFSMTFLQYNSSFQNKMWAYLEVFYFCFS